MTKKDRIKKEKELFADEVMTNMIVTNAVSKGRTMTKEHDDVEDIKTVLLAFLNSFVVYRRTDSFKPVEYIRYKGFEKAADIIERWESEKNETNN